MGPSTTLELLERLLRADTEEQVVALLTDAGYWDDPKAWRYYNDSPDNFQTAGNQQSNPDAALVEKLTNSIDAMLMRECLLREIDPRSSNAPKSVREAVAVFFEGAEIGDVRGHQGNLSQWPGKQRLEVARNINLSVTGETSGPISVTIADLGEGQAPEDLPHTILSLDKGLKQHVPFVQGKWNMGGTGALRFAGERSLQLVLSRRHPRVAAMEEKSNDWGFTIVRREDPGPEHPRTSALTYLAPAGADERPRRGDVLRIDAETLPILPKGGEAYQDPAQWGTLLKLYDYQQSQKSNILRPSGLRWRLATLLPEPALPMRLHECRIAGAPGSFENTLDTLKVRIESSDNLEPGFPDGGVTSLEGQPLRWTVYAFVPKRAKTYRQANGVLFTVNGQTHAAIDQRFFRRKSVGMDNLYRDLLVVVDCSTVTERMHERLFMNSRDRLADTPLSRQLVSDLEDALHQHRGLRALRERRAREEAAAKVEKSRALEEVIDELIRQSPSLAAMFVTGEKLADSRRQAEVPTAEEFRGRDYPTFFKFLRQPSGAKLRRDAHIGERVRISLETDAADDYFTRTTNPGQWQILFDTGNGGGQTVYADGSVHLAKGIANASFHLPNDAQPADEVTVRINVTDPTRLEAFVNEALLTVLAPREHAGGGRRKRRSGPNQYQKDAPPRLRAAGIELPEILEITAESWGERDMNERSALRVQQVGEVSEGNPLYRFYVNVDNMYLKNQRARAGEAAPLRREQFKVALALVALSLLRGEHVGDIAVPEEALDIQDAVALLSDGVAPVLLPIIEAVPNLDLADLIGREEEEDAGGLV